MTQNELLLYRKSLQPSDVPFRAFSSPGWRVPALSVVPQMKQAWRWRVGVPVGAGGRGGLGRALPSLMIYSNTPSQMDLVSLSKNCGCNENSFKKGPLLPFPNRITSLEKGVR